MFGDPGSLIAFRLPYVDEGIFFELLSTRCHLETTVKRFSNIVYTNSAYAGLEVTVRKFWKVWTNSFPLRNSSVSSLPAIIRIGSFNFLLCIKILELCLSSLRYESCFSDL